MTRGELNKFILKQRGWIFCPVTNMSPRWCKGSDVIMDDNIPDYCGSAEEVSKFCHEQGIRLIIEQRTHLHHPRFKVTAFDDIEREWTAEDDNENVARIKAIWKAIG